MLEAVEKQMKVGIMAVMMIAVLVVMRVVVEMHVTNFEYGGDQS